jgi:putative oxidoreductase
MSNVAASTVAETTPRGRSFVGSFVTTLVALCAVVPYALVGLGLRLLLARVFFLAGQSKVDGMVIHLNTRNLEFSFTLPTQIKVSTLQLFETQYASLPFSPKLAAYLFTYAEFLLPICLVLGFATRFSALALLIMTILTTVYVAPAEFWTAHVYWIAILMVLLSVGPGAISFDALIRYLYERDKTPEFH